MKGPAHQHARSDGETGRHSGRLGDVASIGLVGLATIGAVPLIPAEPFTRLADPSYFGVVAYFVTLIVIAVKRVRHGRGSRGERAWLTAFLVGMPLIYIANWIRFGEGVEWLALELGGLVAFGAVAVAAAKRSPWLLSVGIGAHGLWDLAHHGRSGYIPDWYALVCAIVDFALAVYVLAQVPIWLNRRMAG